MSWRPRFKDDETPFDLSGLKDKSIRSRRQLNSAEARNIAVPIEKYLAAPPSRRLAPFTFTWMCKLHKEMFGNVWMWAGQVRTEDLNIGIPWSQVNVKLLELEQDLAYWRQSTDMPIIEQATRLHYRGVYIHPFMNGNGRWARLLANILLAQQHQGFVDWPEQGIVKSNSPIREEYIDAIRKADGGELDALQRLHERYWNTNLL